MLTKADIRDLNCSFRAFRREVVGELSFHGDLFRFISILALQKGFRVIEIPVQHEREEGPSTFFSLGLIGRRVEILQEGSRALDAGPRIVTPAAGDGWLACGSTAIGFDPISNLDDGDMWPTSFAILKIGTAEERKITALVKKAVS